MRRLPPTTILSPVVMATDENEVSVGVKNSRRPSESNVLSYSPFESSRATYELVASEPSLTVPMTTSRPTESNAIVEGPPEMVDREILKYLTPGVTLGGTLDTA
ncbi:unannotated protein [freshwater metagenome]|uniref:Unannotated protein n=1 Tax=freshwater metagenome TaxID=449393 RepID=A0A6J7S8D5_9ZZZZ